MNRSKNGRAHTLPMMPAMLDVIADVPRMVDRDQLFGSRSNGFVAWSSGKAALDARSGVRKWVLHDVRRTVATRMNDQGILPHVVEQILNHTGGHRAGVAGTYNHSLYEKEVRSALARWHDYVRTLVDGGESLVDGGERKVIFMRSKVAS